MCAEFDSNPQTTTRGRAMDEEGFHAQRRRAVLTLGVCQVPGGDQGRRTGCEPSLTNPRPPTPTPQTLNPTPKPRTLKHPPNRSAGEQVAIAVARGGGEDATRGALLRLKHGS